jgi:hypothetical protein
VGAADLFTLRRLAKFVETFRHQVGQFPALKDLEEEGYSRSLVQSAVRKKLIKEWYVTLTSGAIVKGYKKVEL